MKKIIVYWQVADGYVGKSRPQKLTLTIDGWDEMSEFEQFETISEAVDEDFHANIFPEFIFDDIEIKEA